MAKTLAEKLQIRTNSRILLLNAPAGFQLTDLPPGCTLTTEAAGKFECVFLFAQNSAELVAQAPVSLDVIIPDGLFWIAYPKKSADVETDLTRDEGWIALAEAGYRPIRQIAIDEIWSALRFRPSVPEADMVEALFSGGKAHLRPIYDKLITIIQGFGSDITVGPRKSYVALARKKQFCIIKPGSQTRVDVGLKLPGKPFTHRLQAADKMGSDSVTHKIALHSLADIDAELIAWLKEAYENVA
ncbi:MAG: DUF5655 domain-containing protein [Chloroflexota bacterium]